MNYSFNICEIILILLFNCCLPKKTSFKNDINEKANDIIFKKMDIITYVKNMILFYIINKIFIEDDKISIINFFCRPIISINKEEKNKFNVIYKPYKERDFNEFSEEIFDLTKKQNDKAKQMKFLSLTHERLKNFILLVIKY